MTFDNRVLLVRLGQRANLVQAEEAFRAFNMSILILFTSGQEVSDIKPCKASFSCPGTMIFFFYSRGISWVEEWEISFV